MFKVDLARAYRQLPSDPWDWPLLGFSWNDSIFFDTAIPFGVRHGAMACQRTTQALCHIQQEKDDVDAEAYIDDMATVCIDDIVLANKAFTEFCEVLFAQKNITKSDLRSILGKLNHCSKLSPPARRFLNRLLALLRSMKGKSCILLSRGAKLDLKWYMDFLVKYNGRALIRSFLVENLTVEVDACLVGGGGICEGVGYFFYPFTDAILARNLHISALESLNTLVALRVLGQELRGKTVRLFCDNMPTVLALQTGKAKDSFMAFVLRQSWLLCAQLDIQLLVSHKPGAELVTADLLSRGFKTQKDWVKLCEL